MSTVNQQPLLDPLSLSDLFLCWSSANSDTRRASFTALLALMQANLAFPVTPVAPGDVIFMPFVGGVDNLIVSPAPGVVLPAAPAFGQTIEFIAVGTNTAAMTVTVGAQPVKGLYYKGAVVGAGTVVSGGSVVAIYDGTRYQLVASAVVTTVPPVELEYASQGRLTGTTALPVTTADVLAIETLFFTPYKGNRIDLYDPGTATWIRYSFTELTMDVPDANQMNDVFIYNNAGVITADVVAWATDTVRATPLALQNGVLIKSGTPARRYVGSFYSTTAGNGQTEDSLANRYVWNYYNRVVRPMRAALETANSWVYTTAVWRQANANAANQLNFCIGVAEDEVEARVISMYANTNVNQFGYCGIGENITNGNSATSSGPSVTAVVNSPSLGQAVYRGFPSIGKRFLAWVEKSDAVGTGTFQGDGGAATDFQMGINGRVLG